MKGDPLNRLANVLGLSVYIKINVRDWIKAFLGRTSSYAQVYKAIRPTLGP